MEHQVVTDYTKVSAENSNVKVFVRARPCADGSEPDEEMLELSPDNPGKISIKNPSKAHHTEHAFSFDNVYWTDTQQLDVFNACKKRTVDQALKGINSCCFAYGQTGSGKTFSIFGEDNHPGLIPRSVDYLFEKLAEMDSAKKETSIVVSFLEMYCGQIRDLGLAYVDAKGGKKTSEDTQAWYLKHLVHTSTFSRLTTSDEQDPSRAVKDVYEDAQGNVIAKNLSMIPVQSAEEVATIINTGLRLRATHETKMNSRSSRSHTVFSIHVFQRDLATEESTVGIMNMVDLAGSERLKKSESNGQRLKEALHINSSLSAIGKVVMSLDPDSGYAYIPYRDSKLTRILQNSIGGNSFTILIATIHPMKEHYEECLSTLQFANRCRSVQNQPRVNYIGQSNADKDRRIKKLLDEIAYLRRQVEALKNERKSHLASILQELGVEVAEITDSGAVKLADGQVLQGTAKGGDDDSDSEIETPRSSVAEGEAGGASAMLSTSYKGSKGKTGKRSDTQKTIDYLRRERNLVRKKLSSAKESALEYQLELKRDHEKTTMVLVEQKRMIAQLQQEIKEKNATLRELLEGEHSRHALELQSIVQHNKQLLTDQNALLKQIPESLRVNSESLSRAKDAENRIKADAEARMKEKLHVVQLAKEEEIKIIKQQYDYWLTKKEVEAETFVSDFNAYRSKHTTDTRVIKEEFLDLYHYTLQLLQLIRSGETPSHYAMETIGQEMFSDPSKLKLFKSQILTDNELKQNLHTTLLQCSRTEKARRPESAPMRKRPGSAPMPRRQIPTSTSAAPIDKMSRSMPSKRSATLTAEDVDGLNSNELRAELKSMLNTSKSNQEKNIDESGVASTDEKVEALQDKLKHEQRKYRELRSAYVAQTRRLQR